MATDSSPATDELWDEFHRLVNVTSRELREWLMVRDAELMTVGHDPLKPAE